MEVREGMYIRTKDKNGIQYIRKVVDLPKDTRYGSIIVDKYIHNVKWVSKKNVLKASYEKMDLIKPGDYVNGSKLLSIEYAEDGYGNCDKLHYYYSFEDSDKDVNEYYENLNIKSIVTKEQFESMKYVVEK